MTAYTVPLAAGSAGFSAEGLAPGTPVLLERDPGDSRAIRVLTANGEHVGHIHPQSAKWIIARMEKGKYLSARIASQAVAAGDPRRRVQIAIDTEPDLGEGRPWWRRLFG
ncbi:hypothetical protein CLG96_16845 [Sphingomonas oleivorans]|uniref:HIRAN domain-containing protein n=1 Tax=Sphingomonas oleivorans TaxID=1735121 RepID=A0A2T5FU59_9SPHN|nr:HIRAN domain-containing protein [Sphingomonas oleivorans]PTQ07811.1 hypothetical protein CLG96_16845 [Sphingomonas oleivorans]